VATAADIMRGLDLGLDRFKFFPAEASGGIPAVKALSAPFASVRFCPTGGIRPDNAADWLAIPSVLCVGGTWLFKSADEGFDTVAERARTARSLAK
jgi:2-dehydro-3-deoxyphosphogluconate aldolase/(4S)-4-hydroxy-2-oxoglutarate aldolase